MTDHSESHYHTARIPYEVALAMFPGRGPFGILELDRAAAMRAGWQVLPPYDGPALVRTLPCAGACPPTLRDFGVPQ